MDFETRKKYYNLCKVNEPLWPGDDRNVDIDEFEGARVRGFNWVDRFASRIELASEPALELFTGLPGSGKSTELRRLAAQLSRRDGAHLSPVLIDAEEVIDLANEIDIPDLLTAILFKTEEHVLGLEGRDPSEALQESYLTRLWHWLTQTNVDLTKAEYSIPGGPKLVGEMKTRPSLRRKVRETVEGHLSTFLEDLRQEMSLLEERVRRQGYSGLVVIFDSLEKLCGISTNWEKVLNSAERLFGAQAHYLRLPVHTIYTAPVALAARSRRIQIEFMPMIKLKTRDGEPFKAGVDAARELVRRRVPDDILEEILGPQREERLARLIQWSGGYPREIVRLLQETIALRENPVSDEDLNRLVGEILGSYQLLVSEDAYEWLARVATRNELTFENDGHRHAADRMLQNNAVLRYLNEKQWFDLHPAVYSIPGLQKVIARMKAESAGG